MRSTFRRPDPVSARRRSALLLAAVLATALAATGGALAMRSPSLDSQLCPTDRPLSASTLVLVDTSDPLNTIQAATLRVAIRRARDTTPRHGRLTLLLMDSDKPFEPAERLSLCNPGSARDANALFETVDRVRARWDKGFGRPVDEAAAALEHGSPSRASPIMQAITAATWREDFNPRTRSRTLIVVSDLLQQEPGGFTAYRSGRLWPRYATGLGARVPARLAGAKVEVHILHRPEAGARQDAALVEFWRRWFTEHGASSVDFGAETGPARGPAAVGGEGL